ncbi:hypothetical protein GCM10009737_10500 [Nocardioides lentus]|uniref:Uncharacterized protein n=1 Tax=Nocardioides lentus TaxID=338077 RepID=A0ABN2P2Q7_9ACTN
MAVAPGGGDGAPGGLAGGEGDLEGGAEPAVDEPSGASGVEDDTSVLHTPVTRPGAAVRPAGSALPRATSS